MHYGHSEELGDGSKHFEDVEDAGNGELLFVEVLDIDGDVSEYVGGGAASQDFDGAEGVEDYGVDLAVLDIVDGTLPEGDNVAVVNLWFHRVPCDVAPE